MSNNTQFLSQQKFDELELERKELKSAKIPELAKRIDDARQMGDLSENAEYHAAREEMAWAQSRVKEIGRILDNAEIIGSKGTKDGIVGLGSIIMVRVNKKEREYTIVGAQEADPLAGKISNESPLGGAFLGKEKGDTIIVEVPAGKQEYKILKVS